MDGTLGKIIQDHEYMNLDSLKTAYNTVSVHGSLIKLESLITRIFFFTVTIRVPFLIVD